MFSALRAGGVKSADNTASTVDRRTKKRNFRAQWIQRASTRPPANWASPMADLFMMLDKAGIEVDRKVLSDLAIHDPAGFAALVEKAKSNT